MPPPPKKKKIFLLRCTILSSLRTPFCCLSFSLCIYFIFLLHLFLSSSFYLFLFIFLPLYFLISYVFPEWHLQISLSPGGGNTVQDIVQTFYSGLYNQTTLHTVSNTCSDRFSKISVGFFILRFGHMFCHRIASTYHTKFVVGQPIATCGRADFYCNTLKNFYTPKYM